MPRTPWTLTDDSTGSPVVYQFPVNPNKHQVPGRTASTQTDRAISPSGNPIIFQGRDAVVQGSFSGAVISQTAYNELNTWARKWYPLTLADDTGQSWQILIIDLTLDRVKRQNDWRYDYTVKYIEVT